MKLELTTRSVRLLETFVENAPAMSLGKAYNYVKEHQEMNNDLERYEFVILRLFEALGANDNGYMTNKVILDQIKDSDDSIWLALDMASRVQAGYVCGIGATLPPRNKYINRDNQESIRSSKESRVSILKQE